MVIADLEAELQEVQRELNVTVASKNAALTVLNANAETLDELRDSAKYFLAWSACEKDAYKAAHETLTGSASDALLPMAEDAHKCLLAAQDKHYGDVKLFLQPATYDWYKEEIRGIKELQ